MTLMIFGTILPWLLVALGGWLWYQLVRQNGRILLQLEKVEAQIKQLNGAPARTAEPRPQLSAGTTAPDFELPDLAGARQTLTKYRGQRLLLIFFNPQCGFCTKMAPDLADLPIHGNDGSPIPIVITTGDADANRELIKKHKIRGPVLLQKEMEVASHYKVNGTPMGYLVDEQGAIASELAVGATALLALASAPPQPTLATPARKHKHHSRGKANKDLTDSKINREGLQAGTPAPAFTLPRLDGGELSIEDYRGQRTLLVFSDPDCGPCDRLAPHLEQLHRTRDDFSIVMVSRRDEEANRKKVASLGLTFPVALQKNWEISLLYGMFATPIGYLIDQDGIIVADVAKGVDNILALVSTPPQNGDSRSQTLRKEVASA